MVLGKGARPLIGLRHRQLVAPAALDPTDTSSLRGTTRGGTAARPPRSHHTAAPCFPPPSVPRARARPTPASHTFCCYFPTPAATVHFLARRRMADIRHYFRRSGGGAAAAAPAAMCYMRPSSVLSWNANSVHKRQEDGKMQQYLAQRQSQGLLAMPELVCLQETHCTFATSGDRRPGTDLRDLLYRPKQVVPAAMSAGAEDQDSLGLEELGFDGPPATNVTGALDRQRQRLLPADWAVALRHGYWSCRWGGTSWLLQPQPCHTREHPQLTDVRVQQREEGGRGGGALGGQAAQYRVELPRVGAGDGGRGPVHLPGVRAVLRGQCLRPELRNQAARPPPRELGAVSTTTQHRDTAPRHSTTTPPPPHQHVLSPPAQPAFTPHSAVPVAGRCASNSGSFRPASRCCAPATSTWRIGRPT